MCGVPLGLALGFAFLAFALGFGNAKLRTEMARAPVLAQELRYAKVSSWVEVHELRDKGRARILLRVIALDDLPAGERPYRARVTLPIKDSIDIKTGDAVRRRATL